VLLKSRRLVQTHYQSSLAIKTSEAEAQKDTARRSRYLLYANEEKIWIMSVVRNEVQCIVLRFTVEKPSWEILLLLWTKEGLLPSSQEPTNCPYPEPEKAACPLEATVRNLITRDFGTRGLGHFQRNRPCPRLCTFVTCWFLTVRTCQPHAKIQARWPLLSAIRDCLFNLFTATVYIWRSYPPSTGWGRAMLR